MRGRTLEIATWVLLLLLLVLQTVGSMRGHSATADELTHVASGYSALTTGDYRLNRQHPPFVKLLAAVPLLAIDPVINFDDSAWRSSPPDEWGFAARFFYFNDADELLFWSRVPTVILAVILGLYVALWSRQLWGRAGALMALALYVSCPTLIAHAGLVTTDLALSCFSLVTMYHACGSLRTGSRLHLAGCAIGLGLALASKYSAVVVVPSLAVVLGGATLWPPTPRALGDDRTPRPWAVERWRPALGVAVSAAAIVWGAYRCPLDPEFYVHGLRLVNADHLADYPYFLNGEFRVGGWWYYFVAAFVLKTRVAVMLLAVTAGVLAALSGRWRAEASDEVALAAFPLLLLVASSVLAADIGVRYILPVYPFLFVSLARVARWPSRRPVVMLPAALVMALAASEAASIYPHHLSFFNALAGGPAQGHRHLDDSNIDWGQDMLALRRWMQEQGLTEIKLLSPWTAMVPPEVYGIRWQPVSLEQWAAAQPPPGIYAASTHLLIRGEHLAATRGAATDWLARYTPRERIGYSLFIFEHPQPGDRPSRPRAGD